MKKILLVICCLLPFVVKAQYSAQIITGPNISPNINYIYVGSLTLPYDHTANCQKLEVSVLGGVWGANSNGETTFHIANRGGLTISQTVMGSSGINSNSLVAIQNGDATDFYIYVNSYANFYSFAVKSYFFGGYTQAGQMVSIATYSTLPAGGSDITSSVNIQPVLITDAAGNIGINTENPDPAYKLSVNGSVRAKEVKVETGWADYVFKPAYHLLPLKEVKSYIVQNGHLPDMPSEKVVLKEGINLGEMNKLLTKKVEELTLYLLAQQKQLDAQQKQIIQMNKKLCAKPR